MWSTSSKIYNIVYICQCDAMCIVLNIRIYYSVQSPLISNRDIYASSNTLSQNSSAGLFVNLCSGSSTSNRAKKAGHGWSYFGLPPPLPFALLSKDNPTANPKTLNRTWETLFWNKWPQDFEEHELIHKTWSQVSQHETATMQHGALTFKQKNCMIPTSKAPTSSTWYWFHLIPMLPVPCITIESTSKAPGGVVGAARVGAVSSQLSEPQWRVFEPMAQWHSMAMEQNNHLYNRYKRF